MKKMIFLKVKNSYNKKLVTWLDLNLQVALHNKYLNILKKHHLKQCKFKILKNRKGSSYITKYILKNFSKDDLQSLDGYKKLHKIRMFTMSNLDLKTDYFKKLYFNNKELNLKVIEEIKNKTSKYDNLYQFYTLNTTIINENIDEFGEIRKKIKNKNKGNLFTIYKKTQKEETERKTKKLIFDREIETYNKNFIYKENKKINEENDFKNKFKNKFYKKDFYEIKDNYIDLKTKHKIFIIKKYKIEEKKEIILINKIKKLIIKNNENKILYDNEKFKICFVDFKKEEERLQELKKVS